jgi:3'(2'), 5'-bisphosphate nucleotidase
MPSEFLDAARPLAIEAGRRLMALRETKLIKERKADHSLVTNADREADVIICEGLKKSFPSHAILTEESGLEGRADTEYLWVVDPLDGTRAYARGTDGFSVMIGLLHHGKPFAGIVYDPWEERLYEAQSGEGSFETFDKKRERLQVTQRKQWASMPLIASTDLPPAIAEKIKAALPCPWVPSKNSVGIKVGVLVRQEADLYVNHHPVHYWDTVAPQVILEEAGGVFSFPDGKPLIYDLERGFQHLQPPLASNGQRHDEFVRIMHGIL